METRRKQSSDYRKVTISLGEDGDLSEQRVEALAELVKKFDCRKLSTLVQEIADGNIRLARNPLSTNGRKRE